MLIQLIKGKPVTKPARVHVSRKPYPQITVSLPKEAAARAGINGHARVFADPESGEIHVLPPNGDGTEYSVVSNGRNRDIRAACPYFWEGISPQSAQTVYMDGGVKVVSSGLRAEV